MSNQPSANRYSTLLISLHWLMLLLIVTVYCAMEFRGWFPRDSAARGFMKVAHITLGLSVLALVVVRIGARLASAVPAIVPAPSVWEARLAKLTHLLLYAFMIAMPLLGWLMLSAEGRTIPFWGLELPALLEPDKALGHRIEDFHVLLGKLGYFLIGLHALAALVHHYIKRDNTLVRMSLLKRS